MKLQTLLSLLILALVGPACASFATPEPFDDAALRERATTGAKDGIRASAALLSPDQIKSIFGVDLAEGGVQPVWLEIENQSDENVYFLISGMDPDYFSPLEVGFAFHSSFSASSSARIDAHISKLAFDNRPPIVPGASVSGFVYTNPAESTKVVDLDLLGDSRTTSLTLFVPNPLDPEKADEIQAILTRFSEPELVRIEDTERLREALAGLPCCAQDAEGNHLVPLNLAIVGEIDEWVSALLRRDYRYQAVSPLFVFQRAQDSGGSRGAQWVNAQPHVIRLWQTPLRFKGAPVWLGQASSPRGGRFARDPESISAAVDGVRNNVIEDLLYSQNLGTVGYAKGAGCPELAAGRISTDGDRAVMIFGERSVSLGEINFLGWE